MPINRKYPIAELLDACRNYPGLSNARRITFEYVMLKGVNDSIAEAKELVRLLAKIPAKINLIPFNPWPGTRYECSDWAQIERFADIVNRAGYASPIRTPRGRDIMAACGQLKSASEKLRASSLRGERRGESKRVIGARGRSMSFMHILRVLFAILLSGTIGWVSLFAFHFIKITRQFEAFEATASDGEFAKLVQAMETAAYNIDGGSALFLAAGIAGSAPERDFQDAPVPVLCRGDWGADGPVRGRPMAAVQRGGQRTNGRCACHGGVCRGRRLLDDRGAFRPARLMGRAY